MIEIKCLASGSSGNSYAVDDGETVLLLEAGITSKKILSGYAELLDRVAGCLVTHEHKDHAKSAWDLTKSGIDVYTSEGTQKVICAMRSVPNPRSEFFIPRMVCARCLLIAMKGILWRMWALALLIWTMMVVWN